MNKNIFKFGDFQNKRKGNSKMVNETVIAFGDHYKVRTSIDVPFSLVNSYVKKIKDETGQDIKRMYSDMEIAEEIAKYVSSSYLNIENIPTDVLTPEKQDLVVSQGQGQPQGQGQLDLDLDFDLQGQGQGQQSQGQKQGQGQGQGQSQGQSQFNLQGQGQQSQGQGQKVQKTAQKISPQEI